MIDKPIGGVHRSFWAIGVVALIWNVLGAMNFMWQMQADADAIAAYREAERAIIQGRPAWATTGFAIAVFGGALGCILLLLKKSAATYLFVASLLGVTATMVHTLSAGANLGLGEILGIVLMPLAVAVFLIWYSKRAASKGWIR